MASEERPTRFSSCPTCSAMRCTSSSGDTASSFGLGCEDHARQRISPPERIRADLVGTAGQAPHVVQAGARIQETLVAQAVDFAFALKEGGQLEQKRLAVHRLAQELPRPSPIGFEALRAP